MFKKTMLTICAVGFVSATALAQGTPTPPMGPTEVQCQQGYKDGMQWTRDQFTAACAKLNENKKN